ncbi:MAG: hypothetical protein ABI454_12255 [Sphingomicrobium sp.]
MLRLIPIALLALAAMPAVAQVTPAPAPSQQTAAADPKANPLDKMVCRYEDTVGTRLGSHKVCATVREWKDQEDENRQEADRMQQGQGVPVDPMMSPR